MAFDGDAEQEGTDAHERDEERRLEAEHRGRLLALADEQEVA